MQAFFIKYGMAATLMAIASGVSAGEPIHFPWGHSPQAIAPSAPYQVLPRTGGHVPVQPAPIQTLPAKTGYAYGWFGSQPTRHWHQHFGYSNDYKQWSPR